jgi:Domain of unknown function (DUF4349)
VIIWAEPRAAGRRPIAMTSLPRTFTVSPAGRPQAAARRRGPIPGSAGAARAALSAAALGAGACLLLAGCSGGSAVSSPGLAGGVHAAVGGVAAAPAAVPAPPAAAVKQAQLPALSPADSQAIIYTASLTVRAGDVQAAAARAAQLASAAGGYVASETSRLNHRHPAQATVSIQLKIPVARYQATLAGLSARLGTRIALSQRARDVTQTVADVTSRVASAQAAIAQLRRLLARAGSVSSLLMVQDQINSEEANLEALQSEQRALAHQTTYATVSVLLVSRRPPAVTPPVKLAGGFTGGLAAGWRAVRQLTSWLLTGAGVALPFAAAAIVVAVAGRWGRRWLSRRRAGARPAG